jgi:hypothetical protein
VVVMDFPMLGGSSMELVWYAGTFVIDSYLLGEDGTRQCYAAPSSSAIDQT